MKNVICALLMCLAASGSVSAQPLIATPGDIMSELLARQLNPQAVVIAKPGGDGVLAYHALKTREVRFATATTTTLMIAPDANAGFAIKPTEEFKGVTILGRASFLLVARAGRFASIQEALNSREPVTLGGFGAISTCAIVANILRRNYGTDITYVPYKSSGQLVTDVTGGFVDLSCQTADVLDTHVAAGKWVALANLGSDELSLPRLSKFPKVDITFYLLARKDDEGGDAAVQAMRKSREQLPTNRFVTPLPFGSETEASISREREFWRGEVKHLISHP